MGVTNDDDEKLLGTDTDGDEAIEVRMRTWAEPIAERLLGDDSGEGTAALISLLDPIRPPKEALAEMIGGVTAMFLGQGPAEQLPRAAQEAGNGTLRFRRDAKGELCLTIDERPDIALRMSIRDPFIGLLSDTLLPHATCLRACEEVEKAILAGEAWLMGFAYDATRSTSEEAVYSRAPQPGKVEEVREAWAAHDENEAAMQEDRKRRVAEMKAKLARLDDEAGLKIGRLLGTRDDEATYLACSLLLATFERFVYEAFYDLADGDEAQRPKATLVLGHDGRIDNGVRVVPGEIVLDQLDRGIAECWVENGHAPPAPFDARRAVSWATAIGPLVPDLFEGVICSHDPVGMRVTLGPLPE